MRTKAKNKNINNKKNKAAIFYQTKYDAVKSSGRKGKGKIIPEAVSWDEEEIEIEEYSTDQDDKNFEPLIRFPLEMPQRQMRGKGKLVIKEPVAALSAGAAANTDRFSSPLPCPTTKKKRSLTALVIDPNNNGGPRQITISAPRSSGEGRGGWGRKKRRSNINARRNTHNHLRRAHLSVIEYSTTDTDDDYCPNSKVRRSYCRLPRGVEKNLYYAPELPRNGTGGSEKLEETNTHSLIERPVSDLPIDNVSKSRVGNKESDKNGESKGKELPATVLALPASSGSSKRKRRGHKKADKRKSVPEHQNNQNWDLNNDLNSPEKRMLLEDLNLPTQSVIDHENVYRQYPRPIWFLLVASNSKKNIGSLPVLPTCYIQVKDVNMPASAIKKYLVLKLGLAHEDELELRMRGKLVHSDTAVQELMEVWVQTSTRSKCKKRVTVGDSAKNFVMVFTYGWNLDMF